MAGPKTKSKLIKPGIDYKIAKGLSQIRKIMTRTGIPIMQLGEWIAKGPGRTSSSKVLEKHRKIAKEKYKDIEKGLKKARFKSIQRKNKKRIMYGS